MSFPRKPILSLLLAIGLVSAACQGGGGTATTTAPTPASSDSPAASLEPTEEPGAALVPLTVGLGFIPSVQFAPFYLADQAGYYEEAGVDVEFQNKIDPDLITLIGAGSIDAGLADGTSVIPAVSQGIPVRYFATIYGKFPSVVFAKASSGIGEGVQELVNCGRPFPEHQVAVVDEAGTVLGRAGGG